MLPGGLPLLTATANLAGRPLQGRGHPRSPYPGLHGESLLRASSLFAPLGDTPPNADPVIFPLYLQGLLPSRMQLTVAVAAPVRIAPIRLDTLPQTRLAPRRRRPQRRRSGTWTLPADPGPRAPRRACRARVAMRTPHGAAGTPGGNQAWTGRGGEARGVSGQRTRRSPSIRWISVHDTDQRAYARSSRS